MQRTGMRYRDIYREVRCMKTLDKLAKGVWMSGRVDSEAKSNGDEEAVVDERRSPKSIADYYKAGCFPRIQQVYLCDSQQALMHFDAFYSGQAGTAAYPRLEKAIITMEHCGVNLYRMLTHRRFVTSCALVSVYKQAVLGLVVAERAFQFEHRDLHASNLMVSHTSARMVKFELGTMQYSLPSHGSETKIIDFTYARLTTLDGEQLYKDLSTLFDADAEYTVEQPDFYDGYKDMHRARQAQTNWETYCPSSNLAWIKRFTRECLDQLDKNRSHMLKSLNRNSEPNQEMIATKEANVQAKIQTVRDYLEKLLSLTLNCNTTEQFLSALLTDQYNNLVPIKVKNLK